MPHSLRAQIKTLCYKGMLKEKERDRIINALDIADSKPSYNSVKTELDAISRQAVLEGLACIAKAKAKSDAQKSMMGRTMFFVEQLPSVSTEKTGYWFAWKPEDDVWRTTCSECGEETRTLWNYCPNCGAKMVESQESEE